MDTVLRARPRRLSHSGTPPPVRRQLFFALVLVRCYGWDRMPPRVARCARESAERGSSSSSFLRVARWSTGHAEWGVRRSWTAAVGDSSGTSSGWRAMSQRA